MIKRKRLTSVPDSIIGRYSELNNISEISFLEKGMDFRKPEYRREVFLRFYEFHLRNYSHPGGVYFIIDYLANKYDWNQEQIYWYCFINGSTQNPCSSWVVFNQFPDFNNLDLDEFEKWHWENWRRLQYDIDRRYVKGHLSEQVQNYKKLLDGKTQEEFFNGLCVSDDPNENFWPVWKKVFKDFFMYGRLSTFSYLEYLKIGGLNIDCPYMFMDDLTGSKSHRNGMCKVLGRDDLEWHKSNPAVEFHSKEIVEWLETESDILLKEAKERFGNKDFLCDVNNFTLESTLCCYKSWFRVNRRYPNIYMDMMYERIKYAEGKGWEDHNINFDDFWEARKETLPKDLRIEDNPKDPTVIKGNLHPEKQNHFRLTGQVIMIDYEWECFDNDFNKKYYEF